MDLLCINDAYPPADLEYFRLHNIQYPRVDVCYTLRSVINYVVGGKGFLLHEIINPPTPKISPSTGITGMAEQSFFATRFANLDGSEINLQELNVIKERL